MPIFIIKPLLKLSKNKKSLINNNSFKANIKVKKKKYLVI